jgi:hypothetical protein
MSMATETYEQTPRTTSSGISVDGMARMGVEALGALYAKGTAPRLRDLDGAPRGRMLTWVGPLGRDRAFQAVRRFAGSSVFPWGGKSFTSSSDSRGRGINRVRVLGDAFPFETSIAPSVVDGRPCLVLDYDLPANPWFIRQIHDELREVGPGVYLGPAMWKARPSPRLVLYFAIEPLRPRTTASASTSADRKDPRP